MRAGTHAPAFVESIDAATAMAETLMLGLRLREGVGAEEFADAYGYVLSLFAPIDASEAGDSTAAWRAVI